MKRPHIFEMSLGIGFCLVTLSGCAASPLDSARSVDDLDLRQLLLERVGIVIRAQEAVPALTRYAAEGDRDAGGKLGIYYYLGVGVPEDHQRAAELLHRAAEKGNHQAQFIFGCMRARGDGVSRDVSEACRWLKAAADAGERDSHDARRMLSLLEATLPAENPDRSRDGAGERPGGL